MSMKQCFKNSMIVIVVLVLSFVVACSPTTGESMASPSGNENESRNVVENVAEEPTETAVTPTVPSDAQDESEIVVQNVTWILQSLGGHTIIPDAEVTIEFRADGEFSGLAGCNNYFGSYQLNGQQLSVDEIGSTEMWCEGLMDQETAFLELLQKASGIVLDTSGLVIQTTEGDLMFRNASDISVSDESPLAPTDEITAADSPS